MTVRQGHGIVLSNAGEYVKSERETRSLTLAHSFSLKLVGVTIICLELTRREGVSNIFNIYNILV